jgi:hypothetical protein
MMSKRGENITIQGLNTTIDISLPMFRSVSFVIFLLAEEDFSLFNKDNQENWLLVDLDASLSGALSSKDCTPTVMVPLFNRTERSLLLCFLLGNSGSPFCSFKDV